MNYKKILGLLFLISSFLGANFNLLNVLNKSSNSNRGDFSQIVGIMIEFPLDDNPSTTGDGHFLSNSLSNLIIQNEVCFLPNIDKSKCKCDGFIVDPPPHNKNYFEDQIQAVKNYYTTVSNSNFTFDYHVLDNVYEAPLEMKYYSYSDQAIGQLFQDAIILSKNDIDQYLGSINLNYEDVLFIVFHAGVGQDISFPVFDPTNYDIPSAYIDSDMLSNAWIESFNIDRGIILPETMNHVQYDIIEDLFYGEEDYCNYQIGMTGLFALLLGYAINLDVLNNTDDGRPGVGIFGLMDYGSNNGYGVIPAPVSPWNRIKKGWVSFDTVLNTGEVYLNLNDLKKINITEKEYLLLENKNNWVFDDFGLDSLRNREFVYNSNEILNSEYFFDVLEDNLVPANKMTISSETNVILGFDNYDYAMPGSGILIWNINESLIDNIYGINNNSSNKAIYIKEADGAIDIGQECYQWSQSLCDALQKGWMYDFWYSEIDEAGNIIGNREYFFNNPNYSTVTINDYTNPNLKTSSNAKSLIELNNFSQISENMSFNYEKNSLSGVEVEYFSENQVNVIGSGLLNDVACIYYIENNEFCYQFYDEEIPFCSSVSQDLLHASSVLSCSQSYYITPIDENAYFLTEDSLGDCSSMLLNYNLNDLGVFGYINSNYQLEESLEGVSVGDFDGDGLDEIVFVSGQSLDIKNSNGSSIDNFPIDVNFDDNFDNVILVADILNDDSPEVIFKNKNIINIIDINGALVYSLASNYNSELRLVPEWGVNKIALIDGSRLFIFPYNAKQTYWTSKYGTDWNYPQVNPNTLPRQQSASSNDDMFYNYPNPIRNEFTTFRFFSNFEILRPRIYIYDIEGDLIDIFETDINFEFNISEFNEISADLVDYKSGIYFAELKDNNKSLMFTKIAVIK
ncbi:MAG: hypothetical protein CMG00_04550 [Candidatus Marinimicrobia bacterium]|nr:hypothetical protein [Candidatus Neomarinimicrobiota bacterium]